jgi:hypothetical protein
VSRAKLCDDEPVRDEGPVVKQEVATFRFMGGTIIWLDIISSITSGEAPKLFPYHSGVLASGSHTKLESFMGCRNWVLRQIGRIAALHGDRREAKYAGQPNDPEFQQAVIDIGHDIEYGLTGEALGDFGITPGASCGLKNTPPDPITLTTRMFAWMAVVYLHLVTHGFKDLQRLETPITSSLELLRTQIPTQIIPALVAPLFIIGCAAREAEEQDLFRIILASPPFQEPLYKHRAHILAAMEQVWRRRRAENGLTWNDVLGLPNFQHMLLI